MITVHFQEEQSADERKDRKMPIHYSLRDTSYFKFSGGKNVELSTYSSTIFTSIYTMHLVS